MHRETTVPPLTNETLKLKRRLQKNLSERRASRKRLLHGEAALS